jgi:hypothetical protein
VQKLIRFALDPVYWLRAMLPGRGGDLTPAVLAPTAPTARHYKLDCETGRYEYALLPVGLSLGGLVAYGSTTS